MGGDPRKRHSFAGKLNPTNSQGASPLIDAKDQVLLKKRSSKEVARSGREYSHTPFDDDGSQMMPNKRQKVSTQFSQHQHHSSPPSTFEPYNSRLA